MRVYSAAKSIDEIVGIVEQELTAGWRVPVIVEVILRMLRD